MPRPPLLFSLTLLLAACGAPPPPSVLLVTLDTTRADRLGCYGRERAATPNLDVLAERGVRFERAYTAAPVTLPSHTTILTGTYPPYHGVRDNGTFRADPRLVTLAEVLAERGYRTAAFLAAQPLHAEYGLDQGFEVYDARAYGEREDPLLAEGERRGSEVVQQALTWLERFAEPGPFLLWLHLFDPHASYVPPPQLAARFPDDPYQGEVAFADRCLGRVMLDLDQRGLIGSTIVVAVADHGEGLGDHGEETHGLLAHDATMRVPLLVSGPGVPEGAVVDAPVSTADVLPTLLELVGAPVPAEVQGVSLVRAWRGAADPDRPLYIEARYPLYNHGWSPLEGVVRGPWKYVEAPSSPGSEPVLFDVVADPDEERDRAAGEPKLVSELGGTLDAFRAGLPAAVAFDARRTPDEAELALLAGLGYAGGDPGAVSVVGPLPDPRRRVPAARAADRAMALLAEGRVAEALGQVEACEAADPGGLQAHEVRALYEMTAAGGDLEAALSHLLAALELDATREKNWRRLAIVHRTRGELLEALRCQRVAMGLAPVTQEMRAADARLVEEVEAAARALEEEGGTAGAAALWRALAELEPGRPSYAAEAARLAPLD